MKVLIFDPVGGASGDMILGSLIHLGCPREHVHAALEVLRLGPFSMHIAEKPVHGIAAVDLKFVIEETHHHRTFREIQEIISAAALDGPTKALALEIFRLIAVAEGAVHQVPIDEVHFHEVGALDSILDIVGISSALAWFNPEAVYCTTIPLGTGITKSLHGPIPVPAPATMRLLAGLGVRYTGREGELVTPTGAAVIKAVAKPAPIPETIIKGSGYGCGDREYQDWPNLFRAILGETRELSDPVFKVETDVDDMSPEEWEAALEKIYAAGALEAHITPRIMKRGRPGAGLTVLARAEKLQAVIQVILCHTTSIGLRYYPVTRAVLERSEYLANTRYGAVRVKMVIDPCGVKRCKAEYRDLHRISQEKGISMAQLRREIDADIASEGDQTHTTAP